MQCTVQIRWAVNGNVKTQFAVQLDRLGAFYRWVVLGAIRCSNGQYFMGPFAKYCTGYT